MKAKLLNLRQTIGEKLAWAFLCLFGLWLIFALLFAVFMSYLEMSGKTEMTRDIVNWIEWRIDGTFKNSPENIWYDADKQVTIESVTNEVKIGKLVLKIFYKNIYKIKDII